MTCPPRTGPGVMLVLGLKERGVKMAMRKHTAEQISSESRRSGIFSRRRTYPAQSPRQLGHPPAWHPDSVHNRGPAQGWSIAEGSLYLRLPYRVRGAGAFRRRRDSHLERAHLEKAFWARDEETLEGHRHTHRAKPFPLSPEPHSGYGASRLPLAQRPFPTALSHPGTIGDNGASRRG